MLGRMTELLASAGTSAAVLAAPDVVLLFGVGLPCAAVALLGAVGLSWYLLGPYQTRRLAGSRRDRQQMMRSLAEAHGWSWQEWTTTLNRRWKNAPFSGARGRATNVVSGLLQGYPVLAFDYAYQVSSMDADQRWSPVTYDWSVCVVRLPDQLPILKVTRRGVLGRMVATVLPTGLRVPGRTFRRRFTVWSTDRDFAREVLHARTRQLMVDGGVSCLFEGADLLCWAGSGQSVQQLLARVRLLVDIADAIPSTAWRSVA
jgi:hypothetical protein